MEIVKNTALQHHLCGDMNPTLWFFLIFSFSFIYSFVNLFIYFERIRPKSQPKWIFFFTLCNKYYRRDGCHWYEIHGKRILEIDSILTTIERTRKHSLKILKHQKFRVFLKQQQDLENEEKKPTIISETKAKILRIHYGISDLYTICTKIILLHKYLKYF